MEDKIYYQGKKVTITSSGVTTPDKTFPLPDISASGVLCEKPKRSGPGIVAVLAIVCLLYGVYIWGGAFLFLAVLWFALQSKRYHLTIESGSKTIAIFSSRKKAEIEEMSAALNTAIQEK